MYFPLHRLKIPPGNLRRAGIAIIVAIASFAVFLLAHFLSWRLTEYYALQASLIAMLSVIVLAVPYVAGAVAIFLLPAVLYVALDSASLPMVRQWWFWVVVGVSVATGIWLLSVAERRYPKRGRE